MPAKESMPMHKGEKSVCPLLPTTKAMCDVSVVIVSWNTRKMLEDCIRSIDAHTRNIRYETIVVDNASSDDSCQMIEREFPAVRLFCNNKNEGFAYGCNEGMRASRGRYLLLLNSDTLFTENTLGKMVCFLDAKPETGMGGCMLLNDDGTIQPTCADFPTAFAFISGGANPVRLLRRLVFNEIYFSHPFLSHPKHKATRDVDWLAGAFMMVRREVAETVGMMDETIFMYSEEVDWCYRIRKAGWKISYTPETRIIHLGRGSTTISNDDRSVAVLESYLYFFKKHFGTVQAIVYTMTIMLGTPMKMVFWSCSYLFFVKKRPFLKERLDWHLAALRWCRGALRRLTTQQHELIYPS